MMLATICTFKVLLQASFYLSALYLPDGNLIITVKKYNDQPALIGLVGHFNLNINPEITALDSLTMPLVDLRIVEWRNSFIPIRIQEISPPLQHQFAFVDKLRLMDICRPY